MTPSESPSATWDAMTDQQKIEWLAISCMGAFRNARNGTLTLGKSPARPLGIDANAPVWYPLENTHDARQLVNEVAEKVGEGRLLDYVFDCGERTILPAICKAAYLAFQP